jgi:toxin ParE1/3/4
VLEYIAARSPQGAQNVKASVQSTITLLLQHPQAGNLTSKGRLRRIVVRPYPYLIFYRVTEDAVVIHGVRHGARNPATMPR